ncbi:MAG: N-acetylneuraminate synthase family protein [Patescibacteria group bacterium]
MGKIELYEGKKKIISDDPKNPVFFIAEVGINHNGDLRLAKQLIDLAAINGADAIKFQKRTPELCVPEEQKNQPKETPWGDMTYLDYKKKMEFGKAEYDEIDRYCKEKGILWTASPWDIPSVEFLEQYDVPFYKVPSAHLTNKELLLKLKETGKPILLSTGMSTEEEIKKAVEILGEAEVAILHCNSGYPAKDEELNLAYIKKLKEVFPNNVIGYSGHENGIAASLIAAMLGARIVERHITLDRTMWGTDHAASIEYNGLRRLTRDLKKIPIWVGDPVKKVSEIEEKMKKKLRNKDTLFEDKTSYLKSFSSNKTT